MAMTKVVTKSPSQNTPAESVNDLLSRLSNPPLEYRPIPFWFINHCPEEDMLRRQIRIMRQAGFGGVMLHARNGLLPSEYLNERWEKTVSIVLDEAKANGMKLWLYDELQFPSGPAGGRIIDRHPDKPLQYLQLAYEGKEPPEGCFAHVVGTDGGFMAFNIRTQREYPDYLDKEAMADFIAMSYRWYADRFKADFGKTIPAEFTDNACGNFGVFRRSIPWTPSMPELFRNRVGLDFDSVLPSLFSDTKDAPLHRLLFWRFFNDLFLETYIVPIEEECARNGIAATGHYCIEDGTSEHVRQLGDRFEQKLHQHIPGVDMLGSCDSEENADFPVGTASAMIGMTASPAYFYHGSRVLCECLGLTLEWGMTLAEAMRMCSALAALGIDIFVPHGMYYSIAGNRKREAIPDFLHNPMFEFMPILTKKLAQLSMLSSHSLHIAETALFYPITAQQASIEILDGPGLNHGKVCAQIDGASRMAADYLIRNAIPFEFLSEDIISAADIKNGELLITLPDGCIHHIRTIILPSAWIVEEATLPKLEEFKRSGGLIICIGACISAVFDGRSIKPARLDGAPLDAAAIKQNMRHSRITLYDTAGKILLREWVKDGKYFAMLQNFSRDDVKGVRIECNFIPLAIDLEHCEHKRKPNSFTHDFTYGETLLLCETDSTTPVSKEETTEFHDFQMPIGEWKVSLESYNTYRMDTLTCRTEACSRIWECSFKIQDMPEKLYLAMDMEPSSDEPDEWRNHTTPFEDGHVKVYVNGQIVQNIVQGRHFDRWMPEADISRLVRVGQNILSFVHSPIGYHDSSRPLEPPILFGHFGTKDGSIVEAPSSLPTPRWDGTSLERYSGAMLFDAQINIPKELKAHKLRMTLNGVREIAQLFADGNCMTAVMPPYTFDIPSDCKNIRLRLLNTPANLWQTPLPSGVTGGISWSYAD